MLHKLAMESLMGYGSGSDESQRLIPGAADARIPADLQCNHVSCVPLKLHKGHTPSASFTAPPGSEGAESKNKCTEHVSSVLLCEMVIVVGSSAQWSRKLQRKPLRGRPSHFLQTPALTTATSGTLALKGTHFTYVDSAAPHCAHRGRLPASRDEP